jgi:hypothetical protein
MVQALGGRFLDALVSGIDFVLDLLGVRDVVPAVDLVVTGEGSLDEQSLAGKGPCGVARAAVPVPPRGCRPPHRSRADPRGELAAAVSSCIPRTQHVHAHRSDMKVVPARAVQIRASAVGAGGGENHE